MRLTKLKLAGFKSFIDPTTLSFDKQIVGVLGPNGCGKSNIIDAVRWVMGESSAKNLRGGQMADVIFNGSSGRKPASQASIELVFDNNEGKLGGEYSQYSEIAIRREVTRDGTSNYFLNNTKCRRRDIGDVFLGTGLGPRGYTIIEQGMISRVIEAKPEDLRQFVEEAAGISVYKKRRHDTELRMKHTKENLERIEDIRQEQEKQIEKLKKQSETARKYKDYTAEKDQLDIQVIALQSTQMQEELEACGARLRELSLELEQKLTRKNAIESEVERIRVDEHEKRDAYDVVNNKYYELGKQIVAIEQSIQHEKERKDRLADELLQSEASLTELREQIKADTEAQEEITIELAEVEPLLEGLSDRHDHAKELLQDSQMQMDEWSQEWDAKNAKLQKVQSETEIKKVRVAQFDKEISAAQSSIQRAKHELGTIDIESIQSQYEEVSANVEEIELQVSEQNALIDEAGQELESSRAKKSELTELLDEKSLQLQQSVGKHSSLVALQESALNKSDNKLLEFLSANGLDSHPRLAESIQVEAGWEHAAESVLKYHLDAICVDGNDIFNKLSEVDANITLLEKQESNIAPGTLSEKITSNFNLNYWLAKVKVADNIDAANQMRLMLADDESVVTPDGIWLGKSWARRFAKDSQQDGIIERSAKISELEELIETLKVELTDLRSRRDDADSQIKQLETKISDMQNTRIELTNKAQDIKTKAAELTVQHEHDTRRVNSLNNEITEYQQKIEKSDEETAILRAQLQEHIAELEQLNEAREELSEQKNDLQERVRQHREQLDSVSDDLNEVKINKERLSTSLSASQNALARLQGQYDAGLAKKEELTVLIQRDDDPIVQMQEDLAESLENQAQIELQLTNAKKALEQITSAIADLQTQRSDVETEVNESRELVEQQKMNWQSLTVRRETIEEKVAKYDIDITEVAKSLPEDADYHAWEERVVELTKKIDRLGPINLIAIEEYQHECERKEYLDTQYADLLEALETLEGAISKIDKETKTKFKSTFDEINEKFQILFPKLFGGGRANLTLVGDDLLNAGVSVMAQPPGKKNSSIVLLSGGEKALTAVSLVFAIFQLNPAPFCMLDEVDAPLDDANVTRFCKLVKEMSKEVQFIIITHNKVTMEITDQLSSVTMKEPGVSRLVAVNMEEALEMAEA